MSHKALTRRGYVLQKRYVSEEEVEKFKKELEFEPKGCQLFKKFKKNNKFSTYMESELRYFLPRFYGIEAFGLPVKCFFDNEADRGDNCSFSINWDLLPHQHKAWEAIKKQYFNSSGEVGGSEVGNRSIVKGGVFSLYCGGGKTRLAIKLCHDLKAKAIVLVNKEFLLRQWVEAIKCCSNARVGVLQRDRIDIEEKDIVVAMLHSVAMINYPESVFKSFRMAIVDECHHIGTESFSRALPKIGAEYMLGLSATPNRKDGLSKVFTNYLGPLFYTEKRTGNNRVWVKVIEISSSMPCFDTLFMADGITKNTGEMSTVLSNNELLNLFFLEIIGHLLLDKDDRRILILGKRREQLEWLNDMFGKLSYKTKDGKYATSGLYYGNKDLKKEVYWKMLDKSKNCHAIFGTNDIAKEGLDIPELNTEILLNAGGDDDTMEQTVGRILRKVHVGTPPTVIDIVCNCGNFAKHGKARIRYYHRENYIIHKFKITINTEQDILDNLDSLVDFLCRYPEANEPEVLKKRGSGGGLGGGGGDDSEDDWSNDGDFGSDEEGFDMGDGIDDLDFVGVGENIDDDKKKKVVKKVLGGAGGGSQDNKKSGSYKKYNKKNGDNVVMLPNKCLLGDD